MEKLKDIGKGVFKVFKDSKVIGFLKQSPITSQESFSCYDKSGVRTDPKFHSKKEAIKIVKQKFSKS